MRTIYVPNANFHYYVDDTVIYCCAGTLSQAAEYLQAAFKQIETQLLQLRLVLNAGKTKMMVFSKSKVKPHSLSAVTTSQGIALEIVSTFKYLGIILDDNFSFKPHIENLAKKLKVRLGFYFRNKACFSFHSKKRLVAATFLPVLDYGDVLYMNACSTSLLMLDATYHGALRFITGCRSLTHHCILYKKVGWLSLPARRLHHWYIFLYKALLGLLPLYLCTHLTVASNSSYSFRSQDFLSTSVPRARTEFGKRAFVYSAPFTWNGLQKSLILQAFITLHSFKTLITDLLMTEMGVCKCFSA